MSVWDTKFVCQECVFMSYGVIWLGTEVTQIAAIGPMNVCLEAGVAIEV